MLVLLINPIGASELTRGASSSTLGTNPKVKAPLEQGCANGLGPRIEFPGPISEAPTRIIKTASTNGVFRLRRKVKASVDGSSHVTGVKELDSLTGDVEEAQKFCVDAAGGSQDGQKCHALIRGSIRIAIRLHFGAGGVIHQSARRDRRSAAYGCPLRLTSRQQSPENE